MSELPGWPRGDVVTTAIGPEQLGPEPDWNEYRKCSGCQMPTGSPCIALSGRIVNGRPDNVVTVLSFPHKGRERRTPVCEGCGRRHR